MKWKDYASSRSSLLLSARRSADSRVMHYKQAPVWKNAMRLTVMACRLAGQLPDSERFTVRPQIVRAAISVSSNVAEAWARESRKEKAHLLAVAQGSLAELNTQLLVCGALGWISEDRLAQAYELEQVTGRMLTALRRHFRT